MTTPDSSILVLGIDPGPVRPASLAAWTVLSLDVATGTIGVLHRASHLRKAPLAELLQAEPLLSDPRTRLAMIAAPLTPLPLEVKPWRARLVEIRFSRGAFSGSARGPWMPWISQPRTWPRYQQAAHLQAILRDRGFTLISMPSDEQYSVVLPAHGIAEVYPKATLALLSSTASLAGRPTAPRFLHQLDDWLFPRLFMNLESSSLPILTALEARGVNLHFAPETLEEARRIARLRRPFPRREPMRAFLAALQGVLALRGCACLVGAPGDQEGSILLPAAWHSDWETEWNNPRRKIPQLWRVPVRTPSAGRELTLQVPSSLYSPAFESYSPVARAATALLEG